MSSHFPVQYSTLSAVALGEFVADRYGFRDVRCEFLVRGVSDTYVLKTGDAQQYILKVYRGRHRSLDELRGEVELVDTLHRQGAKVAAIVADQSGNKVHEFMAPEGLRYGIVSDFAPGQSHRLLSDEQVIIVAEEMAFNHRITSQVQLSHPRDHYDLQTTLLQPVRELEAAFEGYQEGYDYLQDASERVQRKMRGFDLRSWRLGYCHYDYFPKNFHFDADNRFTLFDFDFAGKGPIVNDLVSFKVHFSIHIIHSFLTSEEADRQWELFLSTYRQSESISREELEAVPALGLMFWTFYLNYQYQHFDDWSNVFFNDVHLRRMIGYMQKWDELNWEE